MTSSLTVRTQAIGPLPPAALVDVAALQAGLPARAAADADGVRPVARLSGAARRAAGGLAQAARRGGHRTASRRWSPRRASRWRSVRGDVVPRHRQHPGAAAVPRQGDHRARIARRPPAGVDRARSPTRSGPDYLDRLAVLRDQVFVLDHMYMSVFSTLRVDPAAGRHDRAAGVDPSRARPAAVFALPTVFTSTWRPAVERAAEQRGAQPQRLARHLFTLATTAPPGKEVRVTGIGERLMRERREAWERWHAPVAAARLASAAWHAAGWAVFGAAYVGAVVFVARAGPASTPATCCSCWPPARACPPTSAPRSARSDSCAASGWTARADWPGSRTTPRRSRAAADLPVPDGDSRRHPASSTSPSPIRAPRAWCWTTFPSRCRPARSWPSSARTAPGRSTLVKLLAKLYEPTQRAGSSWTACRWPAIAGGRLARPAGRRLPGLLPVRAAGPADRRPRRRPARMDDDPAVDGGRRARRGRGRRSNASPPASTRSSGRPGRAASRSSFGQWQKLALARGFMRDQPLLLVLDEPTAALDAETEHALFERYAAAARAAGRRRAHHDPGVAPVLDRAHGRSHRGARRRETGGGRVARGPAGPRRRVRGSVRDSGGGLPPLVWRIACPARAVWLFAPGVTIARGPS